MHVLTTGRWGAAGTDAALTLRPASPRACRPPGLEALGRGGAGRHGGSRSSRPASARSRGSLRVTGHACQPHATLHAASGHAQTPLRGRWTRGPPRRPAVPGSAEASASRSFCACGTGSRSHVGKLLPSVRNPTFPETVTCVHCAGLRPAGSPPTRVTSWGPAAKSTSQRRADRGRRSGPCGDGVTSALLCASPVRRQGDRSLRNAPVRPVTPWVAGGRG